MHPRTIVLFVVLFVAIVVGMFTFTYLKRSELAAPTPPAPAPVVEEPEQDERRLDVTHYFIDGVHTFVGQIDMPTPCDLLEGNAVVMESYPEQIRLDFTVINNAEMCAQVITPQRFKIEATASREAVVTATWNGAPVILNLIPAPAGATPDEFEVFYKG